MTDRFTKVRLQLAEAVLTDPALSALTARIAVTILLRYANRKAFTARGEIKAWPSQARIAAETGCKPEAVRRAKKALIERGYAAVEAGKGRPRKDGEGGQAATSCYIFTWPTLQKANTSEGVSGRKTPPLGGDNQPKYPLRIAPETPSELARKTPPDGTINPLKEPYESEPSETRALALESPAHEPTVDAIFERWWAVYPKQVAKKKARCLFAGILKRGEATAEILIEGALRYRESDRVARGYVKDPTTWLNGGCWADGPDIAPPQRHAGWSGLAQAAAFFGNEP